MTPTIIKTTGESVNVNPKNGTDFSLEECQKIVGGYIEVVYLSDSQIMIVNEDGAINGMKLNNNATLAYMMTKGYMMPIHGDVLVCGTEMLK